MKLQNIHQISKDLEKQYIENNSNFVRFRTGDVLRITRQIGKRKQVLQGICIAKRNRGFSSSFTIINHQESLFNRFELTFFTYHPNIQIKVISQIKNFKKSKLYFLRNKIGKQARIAQKNVISN